MNSQKIRNRLFKAGFALPSVMIASLVLISVLLVSVTGMSALRVSLKNQYYGQLAQLAAEAGVEYAKSCLKANNGVATWFGSTLKVNTDCRGVETTDCPPSSSNSSCYVVNNGNIKTYFGVSAPVLDQTGKASSITATGYTSLTRGSSGQPWRTYSRTAAQLEYKVPMPIVSGTGAGSTGGMYADSSYYYYVFATGGASPTFTVTDGTLVADILVVGGGGSGGVGASGSNAGGGGGGGGIVYQANQTLAPGSYAITVGAGGVSQTSASTAGNNGGNSSFIGGAVSLTAYGGGGGGASATTTASNANGLGGSGVRGSGGGGGSSTFATNGTGGTGGVATASQGFSGGNGYASSTAASRSGGGGGGSTASGVNASSTTGGNGGAGTSAYSSWSTGTSSTIPSSIGGGGGGGSNGATNLTVGSGGNGGGSAGGWDATASNAAITISGGGSGGTGGGPSGAGGSGFVAIRYARNAVNNKIITTNLALFLDAGNPASYPGTGNTWYDLSGNGNHATLSGSPTYSNSNGGTLTFSSALNQFATIANSATIGSNFSGTGGISIVAFVKFDTIGANTLLSKSVSDSPRPYSYYTNSSGNVVFAVGDSTTSATYPTTTALTAGTWNPISFRMSSTSISHYITSLFTLTQTTIASAINRTDSGQALLIGKNDSGSVMLDGTIGMIAVYNTTLTRGQIIQIINTFGPRYGI